MRIIVIGAGRVGLGALGAALAMQGHEVVFAARRGEIVNSINRHGYDVIIKGSVETRIEVRGVRAVIMPGRDFAREVAQAAELQKLTKERSAEYSLDFISQLRPWNPISKLIRDMLREPK